MLVEFLEEIVKGFEADEDEEGGCGGKDIKTASASQTDGRRDPKAGSGGQSAYHILALMEDDGAGTDETDARYDLGSYTGDIPAVFGGTECPFEAVGRDNHKQGRA